MTCIIGLVDADGHCWMAGDRMAINNGSYIVPFGLPKVVRRGSVLLGVSGSAGHVNLLHHTDWPLPEVAEENGSYLFNRLLPFMREQAEQKWLLENSQKGTYVNATLLAMRNGELWRCAGMEAAELVSTGIHGAGDGYPEALGALYAQQGVPDIHPRFRLELALATAASLNITVGPPFDVINDTINDFEDAP